MKLIEYECRTCGIVKEELYRDTEQVKAKIECECGEMMILALNMKHNCHRARVVDLISKDDG